MAKLTPFALAAIALLGACSTTPQPTTPIATIVHPLRAGTGVVQAVMPAPVMISASAGSSEPLQRLEIKMSDGKMQYVDVRSREIAKGDRVQLGADGIIRKV
ncbi:MAG TPA: hypothetical protein VNZ59_06060 [Burkholderiales bacterium]|nr:hypothetical protein [Burkholderiales bacterium]